MDATQNTSVNSKGSESECLELETIPQAYNFEFKDAATSVPFISMPERRNSEFLLRAIPADSGFSQKALFRRLLVFFSLEIIFIILVACCERYNVVFPKSLHRHQKGLKAAVTIISIAWQALAISFLRDIVSHNFSSEWQYMLSQKGDLVPGQTDRVSLLTSSILDQILHSKDGSASWDFRFAFISSLLLLALAGIAPGTISVSSINVSHPSTVPIGALTLSNASDSNILGIRQRAAAITNLEAVESTLFGYSVEPGYIVGWPPRDNGTAGETFTYSSDVVKYNYSCEWKAPTLLYVAAEMQDGAIVYSGVWTWDGAPGGAWRMYYDDDAVGYNPYNRELGIFPLWQTNVNSDVSAYIFLGGNSSILYADGVSPPLYSAIDLGGVPSLFSPLGFNVSPGSGKVNASFPIMGEVVVTIDGIDQMHAMLASALVCRPNTVITSNKVSLVSNGTLSVTNENIQTPIGNIDREAASLVFAESLLSAASTGDLHENTTSGQLNPTSRKLFFANPQFRPSVNQNGVAPLPVSQIAENLNKFVGAASKAYVEGYTFPFTPMETVEVPSNVRRPRSALVLTSVPLFALTVVLVVLATVLMGLVSLREEGRKPLSLATVLPVMEAMRRQSAQPSANAW